MAEYIIADRPLIINNSNGEEIHVAVGDIVVTEANGLHYKCATVDLDTTLARIDADIIIRNAQIEADRLAAEQAALEEAERIAQEQAALAEANPSEPEQTEDFSDELIEVLGV